MFGFVTEDQIKRDIVRALRQAVETDELKAKEAEELGEPYKRRYASMDVLNTPQYRKWIQDRIEDRRKRGLLVTEQQLADIKNRRKLQEYDKAQYIGPTRMEQTKSGRTYTRPSGQTGVIRSAQRGADGRFVYIFQPDAPREALDPNGPNVLVVEFAFKEGTPAYFTLERIPTRADPGLRTDESTLEPVELPPPEGQP